MDGYDKPIQIDEFNNRSNGNQIFNDNQMGDSDDDQLEISDAILTNEKKLNNLIGFQSEDEDSEKDRFKSPKNEIVLKDSENLNFGPITQLF
jgi:hypothetical protein